jgi:hypothetical protein
MHQWIAERRATPQTLVKAEGATDWVPLSSVPEFAASFRAGLPPAPAPMVSQISTSGAVKTSGLAVASLVLGILGLFCGIPGVVGLVLGIVALNQIKKSQGQIEGRGLAIAGIVLSAVFIALMPFIVLPGLARAKARTQSITCQNHLRQLSLGVLMYASDNGNHFPSASKWCDAIQNEVGLPAVFQCPSVPGKRCPYGFNSKLSGLKTDRINPNTVLLFEMKDYDWNGSGARVISGHGHTAKGFIGNVSFVAFADGSVRTVRISELETLRWDP